MTKNIMNEKVYAAMGGCSCVNKDCRSDNIEGGEINIDAGACAQKVHCNDCGAAWEDTYSLTGYTGLDTSEMIANDALDEDEQNTDTVAGHEISWYVDDYMGERVTELDDSSVEHVTAKLVDGYHSGELCISYYPDNNRVDADPVELRGWWEKM